MKKLLILLLLIPTLIQAEEFNLVCEGERLYFDSTKSESITPKTITVKVKEESIKIDKVNYSDTNFEGEISKIETHYIKHDDLIRVFSNITDTPSKEHCGYTTYTAEIDRVSGLIRTEFRRTDECMDKRYFAHFIYEGKCKKQKGNAF